ncbi:hypothetical protein PRK78_000706 [Emydomyces testavorans]|uniref:Uncharacterized protein n=1 Tax=Emydomyces testavorans TaxID=2070801 RepID=A0AAF0DB65_9EURO|nr:hypothetical protein PRK78_000706 [Emydomyces testavorans]
MNGPPPPPPPPPHGSNPRTTADGEAEDGRYRKASDLPDGPYDIFIIPPHSSGSGFLYLPSLQCHRNSFLAGVAATLLGVALYVNVLPVLKNWVATVVQSGGMGVFMLVIGVGVVCWTVGRTQTENGSSPGSRNRDRPGSPNGGRGPRGPPPGSPPSGGPRPAGGPSPSAGGHQYQNFGGQYPGAGFGGPPPNAGPQYPGGQYPGSQFPGGHQYYPGANTAPPPPQSRPEPEPEPEPKPEPKSDTMPEPKPEPKEEAPPSSQPSNAGANPTKDKQKTDWERAREEMRRKEEIRRKMEEFRKKRADEEKKKQEEQERVAREEQQKREKETREKEYREWKEKRAKERAEKEAAEKEAAEKAAKEKARQEAAARFAAVREAAAARRATAEKDAAEKATKSPPSAQPPRAEPKPPFSSGRAAAEDDAYSFRPYDRPRSGAQKQSSASSVFSEATYTSQTTARTTPPPSRRGPYSTKDPDKVIIHGVYSFNNAFMRTPIAQLVSGRGVVTDGLILRITTEGMFVDDDVRGVAQREWDIKAWTMKLVEVWCPLLGANPPPTTRQQPPKLNPFRFGTSHASKIPSSEDSDAHLAGLLKTCKHQCRLEASGGGTHGQSIDRKHVNEQTVEVPGGLHVVRASLRDQEGKRYVFVVPETEAWKVAVGLQRLRKGSQVRALGICGLPLNEAHAIISNLGY